MKIGGTQPTTESGRFMLFAKSGETPFASFPRDTVLQDPDEIAFSNRLSGLSESLELLRSQLLMAGVILSFDPYIADLHLDELLKVGKATLAVLRGLPKKLLPDTVCFDRIIYRQHFRPPIAQRDFADSQTWELG